MRLGASWVLTLTASYAEQMLLLAMFRSSSSTLGKHAVCPEQNSKQKPHFRVYISCRAFQHERSILIYPSEGKNTSNGRVRAKLNDHGVKHT
ncbi:hypothetical protein J6590_071899 [Homalodisca vitripennis]|nr:hypothetical protein J6590_071899 [Homalodisca vitripennis]